MPRGGGRLEWEELKDASKEISLEERQDALHDRVNVAAVDLVRLNEPLKALVRRLEKEVGREKAKEGGEASVQLSHDLGGLHTPLKLLAALLEEGALEFGKACIHADQLLEAVPPQREERIYVHFGGLGCVEEEGGTFLGDKFLQRRLPGKG